MSVSVEDHPRVLLLSSRYDLTCDYVVAGLQRREISYLRLNTEDFNNSAIELDPIEKRLVLQCEDRCYSVTGKNLISVLFRRPVFLRDYGDNRRSYVEEFSRVQWSAFVRNLMIFDEARWINDPTATYRAEHKAVQLSVAAELGFAVPTTWITNAPHRYLPDRQCGRVAIKGLDTVLLRTHDEEIFGFTNFESTERLEPSGWESAPAIFQTALTDKLDIRVTVIGSHVLAASITLDGRPIPGDWRTHKKDAEFQEFDLPLAVVNRCRELVKSLGLVFGAIDLALSGGEYYFLEINPTGEWAWLVDSARLSIDEVIVSALSQEGSSNVV